MVKLSRKIKALNLARVLLGAILLSVISTHSFAGKAKEISDTDIKAEKKPVISVAIMGDSLADGLYAGMVHIFRKYPNVKVKRFSRANTGIVRNDRYDWSDAAKKIAKKDNSNIYVMMFGANDMQTIRENKKNHYFKRDGWVERYQNRIDEMIQAVKKTDNKVFWVGLPIVGQSKVAKGYKFINSIFKARAEANNITFIESWDWFSSDSGKFQMIGKGADGKKKRLRAKDKIHFTSAGYVDLGTYVAKELKIK